MLTGRIVLFGFDEQKVKHILNNENVNKLVVFDNTDEARSIYEKIYASYKDRITLYESDDLISSFDSYCQNRIEEGIQPFDHVFGYEKLYLY